ncbi:hypothetical protein BX616_000284, partial [Lobosporangium transversale]
MKLFKIDFGIKDRYRRGLAQGTRANRSPQSEASATFSNPENDHDPHHQATSPSSPSALFSAGTPSLKSRDERMEQWNELGTSSLETSAVIEEASFNNEVNSSVHPFTTAVAHPHARGSNRHVGQEYDNEYEHEQLNDGYLPSASYVSSSTKDNLSSSSYLLSPSSSYSSDDDEGSDEGSDDGSESDGSQEDDDASDQEVDSPGFSLSQARQHHRSQSQHLYQSQYLDYYGRGYNVGEHAGFLPPAPVPAIVPASDREALEQEARQRRFERHIDKRRQSLNGTQPPP